MRLKLLLFCLLLLSGYGHTQSQTVAAGGNGNGAGGSVSYSVGQAYVISATGADGTQQSGIQQPVNLKALPVEWLSFSADPRPKREVVLTWDTEAERDNDYFTIERSTDASVWEPIGRQNGAGTDRERQTYTFVDDAPHTGTSYYRLKQTDFDGTYTYSPIETVDLTGTGEFRIYPNPVVMDVNIDLDDLDGGPYTYTLSAGTGPSVLTGHLSERTATVPMANLPAGLYVLTVRHDGTLLKTIKIIKK